MGDPVVVRLVVCDGDAVGGVEGVVECDDVRVSDAGDEDDDSVDGSDEEADCE